MMYRMLGEGGAVRILAVNVTAIASETCVRHEVPGPLRSLVAASTVIHAMLSLYMKGEEEMTLNVRLDRPQLDYLAQMEGEGAYRARVSVSDSAAGQHSWTSLLGGMMVMKSLDAKVLHQGVSLVNHASLEAAFRAHLAESMQVDAVVALVVESDGRDVQYAGGVLVERLPAVAGRPSLSESDFQERFASIRRRPVRSVVEELSEGGLRGFDVERLEETRLVWRCQCSEERTEAVLSLLGREDLLSLASEQEHAQVTCHFCRTTWSVSSARILELADELVALEG